MKFLEHPVALILDLALVVAVLYHALNGVRIILMDFGIGIKQHKIIFWSCMAVVVICFVIFAYVAFSYIVDGGTWGGDELKAAVVSTHKGGMWSWLFQRITAVLLIVCLAIHLIYTHISASATSATTPSASAWRTAPSRRWTSSCWRPASTTR